MRWTHRVPPGPATAVTYVAYVAYVVVVMGVAPGGPQALGWAWSCTARNRDTATWV